MTENIVTLNTLVGTNIATGEAVIHDLDEVKINGARVGLVPHVDGARLRLLRLMTKPVEEHLLSEVKRLRAEQGKPDVSDELSRLPSPEEVSKALKMRRRLR